MLPFFIFMRIDDGIRLFFPLFVWEKSYFLAIIPFLHLRYVGKLGLSRKIFHLNIASSGWKPKDLSITNSMKEFTHLQLL